MRRRTTAGRRAVLGACVIAVVTIASCSTNDDAGAPAVTSGAPDGTIVVDVAGTSIPFDHRLLGTNAPAWISPTQLTDPSFHEKLIDMGTSVLRMPGGSWSNAYDWLACETDTGCEWHWAARPSDFAELLAGTGAEGMWTVRINGTAEEAASLVAFFNGEVGDDTVIGVDREGEDWGTVGKWAALRAANGHPDPVRVALWEVGNEVFGARPEAGPECASFGWEDVWTCDGNEYVLGNDDHDGFLRFREEMLAVDPTIEVGAVGIGGDQGEWSAFGDKVIESTAGKIDFYVVHDYGFNSAAPSEEVLDRPSRDWPTTLDDAREALAAANPANTVPIAITEYNMFSFYDGDTDGMMAEAISAFYIADTIGQMALNGASMANLWNLLNGESSSGSDYGVFDAITGATNPTFFAIAMWSRFGDELLLTRIGDDLADLHAYAGRAADGNLTLLVLNPTDQPMTSAIQLDGVSGPLTGTADVMSAPSLDAREVAFNGTVLTSTDLFATTPTNIGEVATGRFSFTFEPYSITLVSLASG